MSFKLIIKCGGYTHKFRVQITWTILNQITFSIKQLRPINTQPIQLVWIIAQQPVSRSQIRVSESLSDSRSAAILG
ncbi:hypothetical protein ACS0TY_026015 [Phlomoides rotata]